MRTCRTCPKWVPALTFTLCVGNQGCNQLQNVLFIVNIGERVIFHGLFEMDCVEDLNAVSLTLQELSTLDQDAAFRVLSIRIEKKVNYFYEVTTSD